MSQQRDDDARFIVVPRRASDRLRRLAVWVGWPLSLALLWGWMAWRAEPTLTALRAEHGELLRVHAATRGTPATFAVSTLMCADATIGYRPPGTYAPTADTGMCL